MKRPKEHVTEDLSVQIFSRSIPTEWINRSLTPDYGLDRVLEIVENGNVTGNELYVQLKGVEKPKVVGGHISYSLKVKNLKYYMKRENPILLVVVDTKRKRCYWVFLQKYVYDILNISRPSWFEQETVTIHIPLENEVAKSSYEIARIAKKGTSYLIVRKIDRIPTEYLIDWKTNSDAIEQLKQIDRKLSRKQVEIKFETSYRHEMEGDVNKSNEILWKIYKDSIASNDDVNSIKAALAITFHLNPMENKENRILYDMLRSVKDKVDAQKNKTFELLWWGVFLETIYCKLVIDYNSAKTLQLVSSQSLHDISSPFLELQKQKILKGILKIRSDMIGAINRSYAEKEYYAYMDLLCRLAKMQWCWCYHESLRGDPTLIYNALKPVETVLLLMRGLARILSKDYEIIILLDLATYYDSINKIELRENCVNEAREIAKQIEHKGHLQEIERRHRYYNSPHPTIHSVLQMDFSQKRESTITDEEEENMIMYLLKIGGINLNSDDELAQLARIGLKDRNPERILKYCEHLHVEILNYGRIWDMVALPSTGTKILHCEKTGKSIIGRELDHLLAGMKEEDCVGCKYHSPRPVDWKWNREWHRKRETPRSMKKAMDNFFKW